MKTALDTSVILDVVTNDPLHADVSEKAIKRALGQGQLVIGECVLAEIATAFSEEALPDFLADWNIVFIPSSRESVIHAGGVFKRYLQRSGNQRRVLPDFLVASHALYHADCLLARNRGYYRDYFKDLKLT